MDGITVKDKFRTAKLGILASAPTAILFCQSVVVHATEVANEVKGEVDNATGATAVTQKVDKASINIYGVLKLFFVSLLLVVIGVCGLIMLVGTQKMIDWVKGHFYHIIIACALLFLAKDIAEGLESIFS